MEGSYRLNAAGYIFRGRTIEMIHCLIHWNRVKGNEELVDHQANS
jgi:hypothetical protein